MKIDAMLTSKFQTSAQSMLDKIALRVRTVLKSPWILTLVLEKSLIANFPWKVLEFGAKVLENSNLVLRFFLYQDVNDIFWEKTYVRYFRSQIIDAITLYCNHVYYLYFILGFLLQNGGHCLVCMLDRTRALKRIEAFR